MARENSKRGNVVAIMKANEGKPMAEVLQIIQDQMSFDKGTARSYYVWIAKNGLAPGEIPEGRAKAEPKAKAEKPAKAAKPAKKAAEPAQEQSPEELAEIKAKNLERIKNVMKKSGSKVKKTKPAEENADEVIKEIGEAAGLPSFEPPAFLAKDDLKSVL